MKRLRWLGLAAIVPALALLVFTAGCGDKDKDKDKDKKDKDASGNVDKDKDGGELKPLEAKVRGTLKGKVTLAGNKPDLDKLTSDLKAAMAKHDKDGDYCLSGSIEDTSQQDWKVGNGGGLAEVFVWVQPPAGHYFKLDENDVKNVPKEVVLDQPHCAFTPHVFALFPSYNDGSETPKSTGQILLVRNSAKRQHNTKWAGPPINRGDNKTLEPAGNLPVKNLKPSDVEVTFQCDMHQWMRAYSRVFDHPFFAITDKDGNFEIKTVPAGVELSVVAWHPAGGFGDGGKSGVKMMIKEGPNEKDLQIKAK